jgi:UDP-N-acetylmuramate dehydrogenase
LYVARSGRTKAHSETASGHARAEPGRRARCCTLEFVPPTVLQIRENVRLAPLTTLGVGGPARFFAEAHTPANIAAAVAWANQRCVPVFLLGGGSNLLVRDAGFDGLVLHMKICGRNHLGANIFAVGAGEVWDDFVQYAVDRRLAGIECLAGIPGSVGGTPVQNVGAYGQEVAETIVAVRAYDRERQTFVEFDRAGCRFRYRESLFNTDEPNRYIVYRVDFQLRPGGAPTLRYADLRQRFSHAGTAPTLAETAAAVRKIRRSKGMLLVEGDPDTRSAGSFFKNPIVAADLLERVAAAAGLPPVEVPHWPAGADRIKLPAAWLVQRAGFAKGYSEGAAGISSRHTLALINRGGATCADIERLQSAIVAAVVERFGIALEREPVLLG